MAFTHIISQSYSANGATPVGYNTTVNAGGESNISETVAANTTDYAVNFAVAPANMKSLFIVSSVDLTIEVNSASSATTTLNLKATQPVVWVAGLGPANPLGSTAITNLYATNQTTNVAALEIRCAYDPTP